MTQKKYRFTDIDGLRSVIGYIQGDEDYKSASGVLFQLYNPRLNIDEEVMVEIISNAFPDACITGVTSANIAGDKLDLGEFPVELSMTCFKETTLIQYDFDMSQTTSFEAGRYMNRVLEEQSDIKCLQIVYASNTNPVSTFMREFKHHHIPKFGIKAGQTIVKENQAHAYGRKVYDNAFVVVAFISRSLKIYMDNNLGWTPIGIEMTLTETTRDIVINEIDKRPAAEIFSKYLKVATNEYFGQNVCEFPLIIKRNNFKMARVPVSCDENGSVYFTSDIHKGDRFRLSYADANRLMSLSAESADELKEFEPEAVYLYECGNRVRFLGTDFLKERNLYQKNHPNLSSVTGFAELFVTPEGEGGDLNSTLVAIGLKEDENAEDRIVIKRSASEADDSAYNNAEIPFIDRILNFLESTSKELDALNKELGKKVYTDQLTQVYNRWELEKKVREAIDISDENHRYGLLFIDIDHFKAVNDNFGHDTGDSVLLGVANIIRDFQKEGHAFGRWGGEEFIYVVRNTDEKELTELAESIRKRIDENSFVTVRHLTISIGITLTEPGDTPESFIKRADNALYEAKETGRNKVVKM